MHRAAAIQRDRRGPQRIVRRRHQYFIAIAEQRPQRQVDQLGSAIADEDGFGGATANAAVLLLQQDGLTRRIDALLVRVAFACGRFCTSARRRISGVRKPYAPGLPMFSEMIS